MSYSQNGWTVIGDNFLKRWNISGRELPLRRGPAGFVLAHFSQWFNNEVEELEGTYDDWGYAYRQISGSSLWSNHASGTAVDLNATKHPQGKHGTFKLEQSEMIQRRLHKIYDGLIRWGGNFSGTVDEMHFEIIGNYAQIDDLSTALDNSPIAEQLRKNNG